MKMIVRTYHVTSRCRITYLATFYFVIRYTNFETWKVAWKILATFQLFMEPTLIRHGNAQKTRRKLRRKVLIGSMTNFKAWRHHQNICRQRDPGSNSSTISPLQQKSAANFNKTERSLVALSIQSLQCMVKQVS